MGISWGMGSTSGGWLCGRFARKSIMQSGFVFLFFSCLLSGPSVFLHLPDWISIMIIGIMTNWYFGSWLVVPVATEVIECT